MKRIIFIISMLAVFCACEKVTSQTVEGQDCLVTINTIGEITSSESELTRSTPSTNDLYAVQVYKGGGNFAWGVFDAAGLMKLNLKTGSVYSLRICMVRDAKNILGDKFSLTNNGLRLYDPSEGPFYVNRSASASNGYHYYNGRRNYYNATNKFFYNSNGYHDCYENAIGTTCYTFFPSEYTNSSSYSSANWELTQIRYGRINNVQYPTCTDWFYGEVNNYSPTGETATLDIVLKRTGFGLKYELHGVTDGDVTVKVFNDTRTFIENTTNTSSYESAEQFIAFYDAYSAWLYADNYTENMKVSVVWKRGIGVTQDLGTKTIQVKRNCMNNIRITLASDDKGAGLSLTTEEESTMGNTSSVIPVE